MVTRGDVVLYSQGGKTYNAIVLATVNLNDSHLGDNDEPQLHLSVLFDEPIDSNTGKPKVKPAWNIPEPTTVHDVVHASHEFDADYMESHGLKVVRENDPNKASAEAEIRNRRGAGEWREVSLLTCFDTNTRHLLNDISPADTRRLQNVVAQKVEEFLTAKKSPDFGDEGRGQAIATEVPNGVSVGSDPQADGDSSPTV